MDLSRITSSYSTVVAVVLLCAHFFAGCDEGTINPGGETAAASTFDHSHAQIWVDEVLFRLEDDAIDPPRASRILAYVGLGIYESTIDGSSSRITLGDQLNSFDAPPALDAEETYDIPTILHATVGHLGPLLFEEPDSADHLAIVGDELIEERRQDGVDDDVISASINRGILLAEILYARALNDGYHQRNDDDFSHPGGEYAWVPTGDFDYPLEPNWNALRPFALPDVDACKPQPPPEFSTDEDSLFFREAFAVWETSQALNDDQIAIAHFWADDPGVTATPPGHWMALAAQLAGDLELDLDETAELFGLLGVTMADAFISCWDEKYRSYLLRPVTYINRYIDDDWQPLINTPPFPEYTSGHSNVSAASAHILETLLGDQSFEDHTHAHRGISARSFQSFRDAAREAANSRLYGGIHYPVGNEQGLIQGRCVADQVLDAVDTTE